MQFLPRLALALALAVAGPLILGPGKPSYAADPDALWHIVHDRCVPHQERFGWPLPCLRVDEASGTAVLKDQRGVAQLLLISLAPVTGIEDPAVLQPGAPNYFQLAWNAAGAVRALVNADLPADALSLAINSRFGRTQEQLHIHIDCLSPDVRDALREHAAAMTDAWEPFPVPLAGRTYQARRVATLDRPGSNPFQIVAAGVAGARADMGAMTIVVAGAMWAGEPGFVILAAHANLTAGYRGAGEALQDHSCALARLP